MRADGKWANGSLLILLSEGNTFSRNTRKSSMRPSICRIHNEWSFILLLPAHFIRRHTISYYDDYIKHHRPPAYTYPKTEGNAFGVKVIKMQSVR